MGYKLIALDVDGTIRSVDSPIAERTRRAVDAAREAGAIVTLATGRGFRSAIVNCTALDINVPIASYQGAYIANPVSGEVLRHCPLTAEMALASLEELYAYPPVSTKSVQAVAHFPGLMYVDRMSEWAESYGRRTEIEVELVGDLREVADAGPTRIVAVGGDDDIAALERDLEPELSKKVLLMRSLSHFCEILHPEGGKESGLAWMCDYFGIQHSETIAFGNGYNDIQMLDWVSLGIAVGDAVPEALAVADRIAPPFEEHGVAQVLEELLDDGLIG